MRIPSLAPALVCASGPAVACLAALPSADTASAASRAIGNPVAGDQGFGTIVEHDAVLGSTETEGTVALGGNLTFGPGYNVAIHAAGNFVDDGDAHPDDGTAHDRAQHPADHTPVPPTTPPTSCPPSDKPTGGYGH